FSVRVALRHHGRPPAAGATKSGCWRSVLFPFGFVVRAKSSDRSCQSNNPLRYYFRNVSLHSDYRDGASITSETYESALIVCVRHGEKTENRVRTMKANCRRSGRDATRFRVSSPKPLGDLMKLKAAFTITICFVGLALVLGGLTSAQQRNAGGERFPQ